MSDDSLNFNVNLNNFSGSLEILLDLAKSQKVDLEEISITKLADQFHQYLTEKEIPAMIYYPVPLYRQEAFSSYVPDNFSFDNIEKLCNSVFSLPIHSEKENSQQDKIIDSVKSFFNSI